MSRRCWQFTHQIRSAADLRQQQRQTSRRGWGGRCIRCGVWQACVSLSLSRFPWGQPSELLVCSSIPGRWTGGISSAWHLLPQSQALPSSKNVVEETQTRVFLLPPPTSPSYLISSLRIIQHLFIIYPSLYSSQIHPTFPTHSTMSYLLNHEVQFPLPMTVYTFYSAMLQPYPLLWHQKVHISIKQHISSSHVGIFKVKQCLNKKKNVPGMLVCIYCLITWKVRLGGLCVLG